MRKCGGTLLIAALAALVPSRAAAADPPGTKRVLLLHQELTSRPFRARFNAAFIDAVRADDESTIEVSEETIDTERFANPVRSQVFKGYLKTKYADRRFDAVVAVGSPALAFARESRDLFGATPIVSVGTPSPRLGAGDNTTGLQGGTWIPETLNLTLAIRPETRTLYVVDGARVGRKD